LLVQFLESIFNLELLFSGNIWD